MQHNVVVRDVTIYKYFIRVEHFDGRPEYFTDESYTIIDRPDVMGFECRVETKNLGNQ